MLEEPLHVGVLGDLRILKNPYMEKFDGVFKKPYVQSFTVFIPLALFI